MHFGPKSVKCSHGHPVDRQRFQDMIGVANPQWKAYAEQLERSNSRPRTNPDGDVCSAWHTELYKCTLTIVVCRSFYRRALGTINSLSPNAPAACRRTAIIQWYHSRAFTALTLNTYCI